MSGPTRRSDRLTTALYRLMIGLLPRVIRDHYAEQMVQAFEDASNAAGMQQGRLGAVFVRVRMFVELVVRAPSEHIQNLRERKRLQLNRTRQTRNRGNLRKSLLSHTIQDLRYAWRRLVQSPGFTVVSVLTLAIGIGANTAIFSLVNGVLIRNRPYRAPNELVHIYSQIDGRSAYANTSYQDLLDIRQLRDVFNEVGAYSGRLSRVTENDEARPVFVEAVTQNLFPLLGLRPHIGRTFLPEEDLVPGEHHVVILGYAYWQRTYGGAPEAIGDVLRLGGAPYTIVGVMPEALESLMLPGVRSDLFVPMMMAASVSQTGDASMYSNRAALDVKVIGRLHPDVKVASATASLDACARQLAAAYPDAFQNRSFNVVPTLDVVIQPDFDRALLIPVAALLMTLVGLVLLLTCTNLASLLLARGFDREKEMAVRLAIGAPRSRLVRQLLAETVLLTALGCSTGLLVARWMLDVLTSVQPPFWVPININHSLDRTVLLFTLVVSAAAVLISGLAPALRSTSPNLAPVLRGDRALTRSRGIDLRRFLVAFQIAIATVLLVVGGLFLRSLQEAKHANPGFTTRHAGVVWLDLAVSGIPPSEWNRLIDELTERGVALPGVDVVGTSNGIPLAVGAWTGNYRIAGAEPPVGEEHHRVRFYCVDRGFFDALGIDLLAGRGVATTDRQGAEPVLVVSEAAARRFWPTDDPLGKIVIEANYEVPMRVVGVARDIKLDRLDEAPQPLFYLPRAQNGHRVENVLLVARGRAQPTDIAADLQRIVREVDSELVIMTASTLEEQFSAMLFPFRAAAGLLAAFGMLALLLAATGLYGVVSFNVSRRTREVGIRMSLGADAGRVIRTMVSDTTGMVVLGTVGGLGAALIIARFLKNFLIGVQPSDLATLVGVPTLLIGVAIVSALIPARRACRICAIDALRHE